MALRIAYLLEHTLFALVNSNTLRYSHIDMTRAS